MAPIMHHDVSAHGGTGRQEAATPSCLLTTLYDVIAALQDGLSQDADALVVATVMHLLRSGRLTWRRQASARLIPSPHAALAAIPCGSPRTTAAQSSSTVQCEAGTAQRGHPESSAQAPDVRSERGRQRPQTGLEELTGSALLQPCGRTAPYRRRLLYACRGSETATIQEDRG
jgi:hypothetical protein